MRSTPVKEMAKRKYILKKLKSLTFFDHAMEKLRNTVRREKYFVDDVIDDWFYGKIQISLGINNKKDTSLLISTVNNLGEVIGA